MNRLDLRSCPAKTVLDLISVDRIQFAVGAVCRLHLGDLSKPAVRLGPVYEMQELVDVFCLLILVVDVECVLVGVDHHQRDGHPEWSLSMFITDHVIQSTVQWMHNKHGPTGSGFGAGGEI